MRATRRQTNAAYGFALRTAMALLIAVAGLACTQASATAASHHPAAPSSAAAQPHVQLQAADGPSTDATASSSGCANAADEQAEAPASIRHEAASTPVAVPGAPTARDHGGARVVPGRGGPAPPPPSPPSYEELSVLRV
ncbi:hypothetical protein E4198_20450 [Streptomyces sp. RKND-216]|uniref:hypothetical protein n=1 Tax=Streptomyces sp. RKND-216 TaxID=2562581 RepID=UPI00109E27F3|nr:hypothetical protein [Streptomyces sp. RKND-216]THA26723.1 hypothetical protein E4198_20450 [Streptomyces sp. RKND-216]